MCSFQDKNLRTYIYQFLFDYFRPPKVSPYFLSTFILLFAAVKFICEYSRHWTKSIGSQTNNKHNGTYRHKTRKVSVIKMLQFCSYIGELKEMQVTSKLTQAFLLRNQIICPKKTGSQSASKYGYAHKYMVYV